jgi:Tfp pilus assembly major pilin PilA
MMVLVLLLITLINLLILAAVIGATAICFKIYSEWVKEAKYRESPAGKT